MSAKGDGHAILAHALQASHATFVGGMSQSPPDPNRQALDLAPIHGLSCACCQAPLGTSDKRCPHCGILQGASSEPARVGLVATTRNARTGQPFVVIQPRRQPPSGMTILGGIVLLAGVGYGFREYTRKAVPPPSASMPARSPSLPPVMSSVSGLPIPDATHADPTLLLPVVQRTLFPQGGAPPLLRIHVIGSTRGTVDLSKPGPSITVVYLNPNPGDHPKDAPLTHPSFVFKANGGGPEPIAARKTDVAAPEPNCTWPAAWRAAVKSGIPEDLPADGLYEMVKGEPRWRITIADRPELTREINGMTCVLKPHG
ncbi:MAG: hypothetical protein RMJ98_06670 [Myxococcales bacterium]|nr:hypothetical protein [Polyangiaceae bacterium]MDW8248968.1 hypothetical protein [Myxococcales bacterium]